MKIGSEIDSLILELTRKGLAPRYIVIGKNQYVDWVKESKYVDVEFDNNYKNCDVVIVNSDIIEVVPEPRTIYEYHKRKRY